MVGVTAHAKKRLKERCGVTKNSALKMAERAYNKGIAFENASTELKKYISSVYLCHGKTCNNIRIYGNMVYIFDNRTLITVYPIPGCIKNKMDDIADSIDMAAEKIYKEYTRSKNISAKHETIPLNECKALDFARNMFSTELHQPYKYSMKRNSIGKYISLSFITPTMAKDYHHIIEEISRETGYSVEINERSNISLLQEEFLKILSRNNVKMIRPASFISDTLATIYINEYVPLCDTIKKEIYDTYGVSVTFNVESNKLCKPICKKPRPKQEQITYEPDFILFQKKKQLNLTFIKSYVKRYLSKNNVHVLLIGLSNDDIGLYLELAVDDFNKIPSTEMQELATRLGIRIKCR